MLRIHITTVWHAGHWRTNLQSIGIEVVCAGERTLLRRR